jgi:intracellular multiplication protein IcmD
MDYHFNQQRSIKVKQTNMQKSVQTRQSWFHAILTLAVISISFHSSNALAAAQNLGQIAATVTTSFGQLAQLITAGAYIAGMGFALGSILKFKQHKDNPQQIPIGTPIALLFIAAALIFLPTIFNIAGQTVFGSGATVGGVTGVSSF